jgi:hypothetical protein
MAIKVYGSQEERNEAHRDEIDAGLLREMNTIIHARAVDTDDPDKVAAAHKEHEAVIDEWRVKQGLPIHSAEFWKEYWEDED